MRRFDFVILLMLVIVGIVVGGNPLANAASNAVSTPTPTLTVNSGVVETPTPNATATRVPTPTKTPTATHTATPTQTTTERSTATPDRSVVVEPTALSQNYPLGPNVHTYNITVVNERDDRNYTRYRRQIRIALDYFDDDYYNELPRANDFEDFDRVPAANATIRIEIVDRSDPTSLHFHRPSPADRENQTATIRISNDLDSNTVGWYVAHPLAKALYNGKLPYRVRSLDPDSKWWVEFSN